MSQKYAAEAQELMKKGDKKLKGGIFSGIFSSKGERAEQALDCYKAAAAKFKLSDMWDEAAEAYIKCAKCEEASEGTSVGEYYQEAANMKKRTDKHECIVLLRKAVEFYQHQDRQGTAGKIQKQIAEIYEQEGEMENAMASYQEASKIFSLETNSQSDFLNMKIKVADFQSEEPTTYNQAIIAYEEIGKKYSENKLTQGIAGNIFFKSLLLSLATGDYIGAQNHIEDYMNVCPPFTNTRQAKLINKLIECFETNNIEEFSQQCFEYNQIIPLDRWQLRVLNQAKEHLTKGVNPLGIGNDNGQENNLNDGL
ncbi:hypothetical protein ABPG74_018495 [Tetrahymena malaccensis]